MTRSELNILILLLALLILAMCGLDQIYNHAFSTTP